MKKMLLTVDPQYDFITGSLPVPGAVEAMNALALRLREAPGYALKIVTCDWHPWGHCSFERNGGQWPPHCVQYSRGAAIWEPLLAALMETEGETRVFLKGRDSSKEEYSIFDNGDNASSIGSLVKERQIEAIDICGLAGDICVLSTLKDGVAFLDGVKFNVLGDFSPSLDGGAALKGWMGENMSCDRS